MSEQGEILFLCHRIPFPPDRGDKIRSWNLLRAAARMAPVHVGCFADDARDMGFADDMARITASQCVLMRDRSRPVAAIDGLIRRQPMLVALYEKPELRRWVASVLRDRPIRAILAYSVQMAHFLPETLPNTIRFMMDFVDFDSAKYAAYGAGQR
ncbi:MAG: glycosyl transferase family 1, partial [Sphingobium sp. 32-64-5]